MAMSPPSPRQAEAFGRKMAGEDLSRFPELRHLLVAAQKLPGAQDSIRELLRAVITRGGPRPEVVLQAEELSQIRQPVLLVWGSRDAFGSPSVGGGTGGDGLRVEGATKRTRPASATEPLKGAGREPGGLNTELRWVASIPQLPVGSGMVTPSLASESRTYLNRWYAEMVIGPLYDSLWSFRGGYST